MLIKNKKGVSYFIFDAVIAATIFFIAISSMLTTVDYSTELETPRAYGEDLITYYTETEIRDLDLQIIEELIENENITNPENSILEQILIFHHDNKDVILQDFIVNVSQGKIPEAFGLNITIEDSEIYSRTTTIEQYKSLTKVRRVAFTKLDDGSLYGPKKLAISVWY